MSKEEQDALFDLFDDLNQYREEQEQLKEIRPLNDEVDNFIIDKIKDALIKENWNQTRASNCLGVKRTTLVHMCKRLKIF